MKDDQYRQAISKTIGQLEECKAILIDCLFELVINGELKTWADVVEVDESFYFSRELYESLDDPNIQHILWIINHLEVKFPV